MGANLTTTVGGEGSMTVDGDQTEHYKQNQFITVDDKEIHLVRNKYLCDAKGPIEFKSENGVFQDVQDTHVSATPGVVKASTTKEISLAVHDTLLMLNNGGITLQIGSSSIVMTKERILIKSPEIRCEGSESNMTLNGNAVVDSSGLLQMIHSGTKSNVTVLESAVAAESENITVLGKNEVNLKGGAATVKLSGPFVELNG